MNATTVIFRTTLWVGIVCGILVSSLSRCLAAPRNAPASQAKAGQEMLRARESMERGDFESATRSLKGVARFYEAAKATEEQLEAVVLLAQAYQSLGRHQVSVTTLNAALPVAQKDGNEKQVAAIQSLLGVGLTFLRQGDKAEGYLRESLAAAAKGRDTMASSSVLINLGNLFSVQRKFPEAINSYVQAAESAHAAGDSWLSAKAWANAALCSVYQTNIASAETFGGRAHEETARLAPSHEQATLYLSLSETFRLISCAGETSRSRSLPLARQAAQQALEIARQIGGHTAESAALGSLARCYELDGRKADALLLTRKAIFAAQQANDPDAMFQWEWQSGKLLKSLGEKESAIAAYRRAIQTLDGIRIDRLLGYGNRLAEDSFRETTGAVYFELADLLLEQADQARTASEIQEYLVEARDTVELLRSAELEDYFQDECVNIVRSKSTSIESVAARTAVIYSISLPDRLELLVGTSAGWKRFKVALRDEELTKTVNEFRFLLEKRTTSQYLLPARQLYQLLITPLLDDLKAQQIDTLVFISDGALRNIPMAALQDGEKFLVDHFAVATTPGLALTDPKPLKLQKASLLLTGVSKSVQGFSALDFVTSEIQTLRTNYQAKVLLDEGFSLANVQKEMKQAGYSLIHIASHGQFDRDSKKCFLLTHDRKLTLDELERMIRPGQYHGQPVELLTLSACQTAAGDDQAALGLAGVALKAGARSALATLWFVSDEASVALMAEFYSQMRRDPALTKAKALQAAQLKLIQDARFRHPCYWAPYLIIGNWL